jgi:hypothetical protein
MVRKFTFQFKLCSDASENYEFPHHISNETLLKKGEKKNGKANISYCVHRVHTKYILHKGKRKRDVQYLEL